MVISQNWREKDLKVENALESTGIILSRLNKTPSFWMFDFAENLL